MGKQPETVALGLLALPFIELNVSRVAVDEPPPQVEIGAIPQEHASRRVAIAPRAASLLVICLDTFRRIQMNDVANVRLVDAHAEGVRCHDHRNRIRDEPLLVYPALLGGKARVVMPHPHTQGRKLMHQVLRKLVHLLARRAVHDAALLRMRTHVIAHPSNLRLIAQLLHFEIKVGTVESRRDRLRRTKAEHRGNIRTHALRCRRGKGGKHRTLGKRGNERGYLEVRRAEVLPPLGYAMRLVNGNERYANSTRSRRRPCEREKARIGQALGSHVHNLVPALGGSFEHGVLLRRRKR